MGASKLYIHDSRRVDEEFRQIYRELGRLRGGGGTGTGTAADGDGDPDPAPPPPLATQVFRFAQLLEVDHQYNPAGQATVYQWALADLESAYTVLATFNYPLSHTPVGDPTSLTLRLQVLGTNDRLRPYGSEFWINPLFDQHDFGYWSAYETMTIPRSGDHEGGTLCHYPVNPRGGQDTIRARLIVDRQTTFCYRSWLTGIFVVHGTVVTGNCPGYPA